MQKPWLEHYPPGVPHDIDPSVFNSINDVFDNAVKNFGDLPAFSCMGTQLTYKELDEHVAHFAAYLQSHTPLKPGDHIALQMPNLLQYPVALFGALRAGLVVVNFNPLYTPREMQHQLDDSDSKAIVIDSMFAHKLQKILPKTDLKHIIVADFGCMHPPVKRFVINSVVKYIKRLVPGYQLPGIVKFQEALKLGSQASFKPVERQSTDLAFIQYTGGTTGVSKGAMLTNRNLVANMEQLCVSLGGSFEDGKEVMITALPMYHIFALTVNCLQMVRMGGMNVLIPNPRDLKGFVKEMGKHKFTAITGVNTLYNALNNFPAFSQLDFSHMKVAAAGGMALQKNVAIEWKKITGMEIVEGYGLTETSPVSHMNPPAGGENRLGTIGMPIPSTDIKLVDEEGNMVTTPGERGEVYIKGPQVMLGYYNRPQETQNVLQDGWLRTGDIATMDPDGYFRIVDRKKDMILVSGFNVYPNEIEDVVTLHPDVLECVAVGKPDEHSGEVVKIFVVKKNPALTEEALLEYCRENLTGYKRPKDIEFRDELPKSNVGKLLRKPLRDEELNKAEKEKAA